jgi:hypothetical protein
MSAINASSAKLIRYRGASLNHIPLVCRLMILQDPKKSRELYSSWVPTESEAVALQAESYPISCEGRRGLLNLGQTCALNTVLQSFLHNPLLRNYFLSDKHNSKLSSLSDGPKYKLCKAKECMCCEVDRLFSEVYSATLTKCNSDPDTRFSRVTRLLTLRLLSSPYFGAPLVRLYPKDMLSTMPTKF